MPLPIVAGVALATGIINLISDLTSSGAQNSKIAALIKALEELKITGFEAEGNIDAISDIFNTGILNTLNETSIGVALGGIVNPEFLKANITASLLGESAKAQLAETRRIEGINREIGFQQSTLGLQTQTSDPFTAFARGTIEGAGLGIQFESYLDTIKEKDKFDQLFDDEQTDIGIPINLFQLNLGPTLFDIDKTLVG